MKYVSTRGQAPTLEFDDVVTCGLAADGGLYVPAQWPVVSSATLQGWMSLSYTELVVEVMSLFAGDAIARSDLRRMAEKAYASFSHPALAPLVQLEEKLWIMELFHGPTLAFKDFALQFLGQLFEHILARKQEHRVIVGATSGDTGSAAIEAVRGLEHVTLFMLHPKGRVSDVQRRQMTTVTDTNIHNVAVDGNFDDCQALVKAMFNDAPFREEMKLSAVNSINWARVAAQVVYYFRAALTLGAATHPVSFSVPSGNFGNAFAGHVAREMGLPVNQLIVGSNHNDILTRFFATGTMQTHGVSPSIAPSMDIQMSSNFERLLFELTGRDGSMVGGWMNRFVDEGCFSVTDEQYSQACSLFSAGQLDDNATQAEMKRLHRGCGYIIDPHSAIGVATARRENSAADTQMIVLGTAHPAKFPQAVVAAIGEEPLLPPRLRHIMRADEKMLEAPADLAGMQQLMRDCHIV